MYDKHWVIGFYFAQINGLQMALENRVHIIVNQYKMFHELIITSLLHITPSTSVRGKFQVKVTVNELIKWECLSHCDITLFNYGFAALSALLQKYQSGWLQSCTCTCYSGEPKFLFHFNFNPNEARTHALWRLPSNLLTCQIEQFINREMNLPRRVNFDD